MQRQEGIRVLRTAEVYGPYTNEDLGGEALDSRAEHMREVADA